MIKKEIIMNKLLKLLSISAVIGLIAVSCDLNKYPYDQIEQTQAFKTMKDAAALRNGLYAQLRGRFDGIYQFSTDVQADQLNATLDYGNRNGFPHKWTSFLAGDYTIRDVWQYWYNSIANINNFIENAKLIDTEGSDANVATLNQYLGEAYLLRAFYYHQLVLRWAKAYDPATAGTDLAVPLLVKYDVALKPSRATVAEVYDLILSDIGKAKTFLADVDGAASSTRLTIDCVDALEARVKLCMKDYTGAAAAADLVIGNTTYSLIDNVTDLRKMWVNDVSSEVLFQLFCSQPNELPNANSIYLGYNMTINRYIPDFVPEQWAVDMFPAADIRKQVYLGQKLLQIQGTDYPNIYCVTKYSGNPTLFTAASSNYMQKPKVFRLAELYLISAEAKAQTVAGEPAALNTLNILRTKRGLPSISVSGAALMDSIKLERTRELFCEGFRLDDLKRWNMGFSRKAPQNINLIVTGTDFNQKVVTAGDDKFEWGIPSNDITTNKNLANQQNPGW
jgi:starch-binding outer membrane protein, SusD/RagB family